MLEFSTDDNHYIVTEKILGFSDTKVKTVKYKKDLSELQINNNPYRPVDQVTKDWFMKYYMKHFKP